MGYFTKSRFRLALNCPTKLYYGANKEIYANKQLDDTFLTALAEGGYQVGELAKYLFCIDPIREDITVRELDYLKSLESTENKRGKGGRVVVAEAAFKYDNFFVRTDLIVEEGNIIKLYEVKAKSWDEQVEFLKTNKKGETTINSKWVSYLYDVAFQKWVVSKANPGKEVRAHLVLVDKMKEVTIDGLNQIFKLKREGERTSVEVDGTITQSDLGYIPLKIINVEDVCAWIYANPVDIHLDGQWKFEDLIYFLADTYKRNEIVWTNSIGKKCKTCEFINDEYPVAAKSGFHECWKKLADFKDADFQQPLVLELWCGGSGGTITNAIAQNIYHLKDVAESLYAPKKAPEPKPGLSSTERRNIQVLKSKTDDYEPYIDLEGLKEVFESFPAPYHFIDFETTMVAIPLSQGTEGL